MTESWELGKLPLIPPMRVKIEKISKSEFGLLKVLLYFSKPQNLYGITVFCYKRGAPCFEKQKFNQNIPIVLLKMFGTNLDCT